MPASSLASRRTPSAPPAFDRRVQRRGARAPARRARRVASTARTAGATPAPTTRFAARLGRGHRVEQVAADAGIVERVEHGTDHHGLAARRRELFVPGEILRALLPVEEQARAAPS